jgi:hypothetical protein
MSREWSERQLGPAWMAVNANKRSITLDLARPEAIEIVRRIAADADIVCENFRPGVMEKLGLGYDVLRAIRPDLVVASISGYGSSGPLADYMGYGPTTGPRRPSVARVLVALATAAAMLAACAPEPLPTAELDPIRVDESLGVVRIARGERIDVRLLADLTGDDPRAATMVAAARAAVEDFGPIQGFPVDLGDPLDAGCDGPMATEAAGTVIAAESVLGVVGPDCDVSLAAAAPLLTAAGLPEWFCPADLAALLVGAGAGSTLTLLFQPLLLLSRRPPPQVAFSLQLPS